MPITQLNHAVLYVADLDVSRDFYCSVLGFRVRHAMPGAVFLQAAGSKNDHDLGLFAIGAQPPVRQPTIGLYHLAWEVSTLSELERLAGRLEASAAWTGAADHGATKAIYGKDPDGIAFELCWLVPSALLSPEIAMGTQPLDLNQEKAKYGAQTLGGVGVSWGVTDPSIG